MKRLFFLKDYFLFFILLHGGSFLVKAQTIQLEFPKFANKAYAYVLMQGDTKDTIAKGTLDKNGKTTLKIPKEYKEYKGMSQWMLTDGGGLDMIINKENFSVGSPEAQPHEGNIKYAGSKENIYLNEEYKKQELLFQKAELLRMTTQMYDSKETMYDILKKEWQKQEEQLNLLQIQNANSPLYAARFRVIADFIGGTTPKVYASEEERGKDLVEFVSNKVDAEVLYTSGHWNSLISEWMEIELNFIKNDNQLLSNTKKLLTRTQTGKVYDALTQKIVSLYTKYGKDDLLKELALFIKEEGRLINPSWALQRLAYGQMGENAPAIIGLENPIESASGKNTLLFFYQSGCGSCESELKKLKDNFSEIEKRDTRLISIAADSDQDIYKYAAAGFPWGDKLWDEKMFEGENFKNYGIIGTPTYIMINEEGKIAGKYAELEDIKLLKTAL